MNNTLPKPFYAKDALEKPITIGIATTSEEKMEIYRLRYHIYAEEISHPLVSIDHSKKLIYDELDKWGLLLYVKAGAELIGTLRINIGQFADFPSKLVQEFSLDRFQKFYDRKGNPIFAYNSRGMVSSPYRRSGAHNLLEEKSYELYCDKKVQFSFGDCNFHLIPFHEHYGYRRYTRNWANTDYGLQMPFVLLVDDIDHLRAVDSPLFHIASERGESNNQVVDWFRSEFPEAASVINSRLVSEEELWACLNQRLGRSPNKAIPVLRGLSEREAKKFLHLCGVIIRCYAGDPIMTCGDSCNELNILLSGKIQSSSINNILQGQHFGEIGLMNRTKHILNITAVTDAEILVLSLYSFQKLRRSCPEIANKVLYNLIGITHDKKDKYHKWW